MIDAVEAYNAGAETYSKFQAAKARGDTTEQAIGQIAGTIGGGAACVAAGAAVVAPICASLGGTIGRAIGGLFGAGEPDAPDYAPAICAHVERALDDLSQDAAANGVSVPRAQLRAWFADAADRASLARTGAPKIAILGEIGRSGSSIRFPNGIVQPLVNGALPKGKPSLSLWALYRIWLPWSPNPVETCLWQGTVVRNPDPVVRMASVGLAAVAARIVDATALRIQAGTDTITIRDGRVVSARIVDATALRIQAGTRVVSGGPTGLFALAVGIVVAIGGLAWWKRKRH